MNYFHKSFWVSFSFDFFFLFPKTEKISFPPFSNKNKNMKMTVNTESHQQNIQTRTNRATRPKYLIWSLKTQKYTKPTSQNKILSHINTKDQSIIAHHSTRSETEITFINVISYIKEQWKVWGVFHWFYQKKRLWRAPRSSNMKRPLLPTTTHQPSLSLKAVPLYTLLSLSPEDLGSWNCTMICVLGTGR